MKHRTRRGARALVIALLVTVLVGGSAPLIEVVHAEPALPVQPGSIVDPHSPSLSSVDTLWAITSNNTTGASLAVDANGGVHAAISAHTAVNGIYPVYYGYCAAGCRDADNWEWTIVGVLGTAGEGARLALDPQGRPRIMWFYLQSLFADQAYWEYAGCDGNCLDTDSWTVVDVVTVNSVTSPGKGHYFALDHLGRPRFIFREIDEWAGRTGTYDAYCDADCADGGTWYERRIQIELLYDPSLVFTSTGQPRIAYRTGDQLAYVESSNGGQTWSGDLSSTLGSGAAFSLRLDSQNRPRLAIYYGYLDEDPSSDLLAYAWCQVNCHTLNGWSVRNVGLPNDYGKDVDLVLDAQNRPHLTYNVDYIGSPSVYGLGYARCTARCETNIPTWQPALVNTSEQVDQSDPIPVKQGCGLSSWVAVGQKPSITVDGAGNVRIGYDCKHYQGGSCTVTPDITLVRLAIMGDGGGGGDDPPPDQTERLYIPVLRKR